MNFSEEAIEYICSACKDTWITRPLPDFPEYSLASCVMEGKTVCRFLIIPRPPQEERADMFAAQIRADAIQSLTGYLRRETGAAAIYEDRWYRENEIIRTRIAAHLHRYEKVMALVIVSILLIGYVYIVFNFL